MAIAIKKLDEADHRDFENFLRGERRDLPALNVARLAHPHEDVAVVASKRGDFDLAHISAKHELMSTKCGDDAFILSRSEPIREDGGQAVMSGYVFRDSKMIIGMSELSRSGLSITDLNEEPGEFCTCVVKGGVIELRADFFGMVPWFYFDDDQVFIASNNYHLMLDILKEMRVGLSMNIKRSRVNMITSGFTYGAPFSVNLDVEKCKISLPYEVIKYDAENGVTFDRTELWEILSRPYDWEEDRYEELVEGAKAEIYSHCKAAFEHPSFAEIVVDVSGGFDSRIVFATACNLPKKLRKKMVTHTRPSGSPDDFAKAIALVNIFDYPQKIYDSHPDPTPLFGPSNSINLDHVSRTLGVFSPNPTVYTASYQNRTSIQLTGYLGEVVLGFKRVRGELDYSLGDKRLLSRIGGSVLHNSVDELQGVFADQEEIILNTLASYPCDGLFKKFHLFYTDFRNRFICGSSHIVENNNFRIPMLFSKNALKAKWLYFSKFPENAIPDEKLSIDLLTAINPLFAVFPFEKSNDDVIPPKENLLNPVKVNVTPDVAYSDNRPKHRPVNTYRRQAISYSDDLDVAEQMLLQIYDYSEEYHPVCLGMFKVLSVCRENPSEHPTGKSREVIRKIYDIFYQMELTLPPREHEMARA